MPLTTKQIAEYAELINNALDNIPVRNKRDFIPLREGLQDILQPNSDKNPINNTIQEHLSDIADILNDPALGYTELETFSEFQQIIRQRIAAKIQEFQSMTRSQQARYIRKQKQKAGKASHTKIKLAQTANDSKWLEKQQMYNTGESETEEQMLARLQQEFQNEGLFEDIPQDFIDNWEQISILIEQTEFTLTQLINMPPQIRATLFEDIDIAIYLITRRGFSLSQVTSLVELKQAHPEVQDEQLYQNLIFLELLDLMDPESYADILPKANAFISLITQEQISLNEITFFPKAYAIIKLITQTHISLDEILGKLATMDEAIRTEFFEHANNIRILITEARIPFEQLMAMEPAIRSEFLQHPSILRSNNIISFEQLLAMEPAIRSEFLQYAEAVSSLINDAHFSFNQLLAMEPAIRSEFFQHKEGFSKLINDIPLSFDTLLAMEPAVRSEFLQYPYQINRLLNVIHLPFNQLLTMEPTVRSALLQYLHHVEDLTNNTPISLEQLLIMEPVICCEFIQNAAGVCRLVNNTHLSLDQLLEMEPTIRSDFLRYTSDVETLINDEHISFDQLLTMKAVDRTTLLYNSSSPESLEIISRIKTQEPEEPPSYRRPRF